MLASKGRTHHLLRPACMIGRGSCGIANRDHFPPPSHSPNPPSSGGQEDTEHVPDTIRGIPRLRPLPKHVLSPTKRQWPPQRRVIRCNDTSSPTTSLSRSLSAETPSPPQRVHPHCSPRRCPLSDHSMSHATCPHRTIFRPSARSIPHDASIATPTVYSSPRQHVLPPCCVHAGHLPPRRPLLSGSPARPVHLAY